MAEWLPCPWAGTLPTSKKAKYGVPDRCYCGAPWQRHYRAGYLVAVLCTRGHDPIESLRRVVVRKHVPDA